MVILGINTTLLQTGLGASGVLTPPTQGVRLRGAAIAVADLDLAVSFFNEHFGLQLLARLDGPGQLPRALVATDLAPGAFQLELLEAPLPLSSTTTASGAASGGTVAAGPVGSRQDPTSPTHVLEGPLASPAPPAADVGGVGHFTLVVPSTAAVVSKLESSSQGGLVLEECAAVIPVKSHGHSYTDRISRVSDPDGYTWQLMEVHSSKVRERLCSIMIRVSNLHKALKWYTGVLGMRVHQQYESEQTGYLSALVGYGPELQCTLLELRQQWQPGKQTGQPEQQLHPGLENLAGLAAATDLVGGLEDLPPAVPAVQQQQQDRQEQQQGQQQERQQWEEWQEEQEQGMVPAGSGPHLYRFVVETPDLAANAQKLQEQGQPFERVQLPSCEDPGQAAEALAVLDADGWAFCFVERLQGAAEAAGEEEEEAPAAMEE